MNINPFENALKQLDKAISHLKLSPYQIERLRNSEKVISVNFPVKMDNGQTRLFHGFRVQHNSARGPYKGGIRFHHQVDMNEVKALAFWMAIKCAVADIPMGGGKGGVEVNPKDLSSGELERLSRAYSRAIADDIGQDKDVPAPDVNTTPQIMKWMVDEYVKFKIKNLKLKIDDSERSRLMGTFTGKPVEYGGSLGRTEATGRGGYHVLMSFLAKLKLKGQYGQNLAVAVQGMGNVGYYIAKFLTEEGMRVVAMSDSKGAIAVNDLKTGKLDPEAVLKFKKEKGKIKGYPGTKAITNEEMLELSVDILVPAALENQITGKNASRIKAKTVLEMANGPTTPEADEIFNKKGITIIPDVLANSGGVTVSCFEWEQNLKNEHWTEQAVNNKLKKKMEAAADAVWQTSKNKKTDLRTAAFIVAVGRIISKT